MAEAESEFSQQLSFCGWIRPNFSRWREILISLPILMMIIFFLDGFTRWRKRINCTDCHQRLGLESLSCEQHWQLKIELRLFRFGLNMSHIKQFWSTIFKLVVASGNSGLAELQFTDVHNFNFSPGFPYVNLLRKWWELSLVNYLSFYFNTRSAFCFSVDFEANEAQAALNGQVSAKVGDHALYIPLQLKIPTAKWDLSPFSNWLSGYLF